MTYAALTLLAICIIVPTGAVVRDAIKARLPRGHKRRVHVPHAECKSGNPHFCAAFNHARRIAK